MKRPMSAPGTRSCADPFDQRSRRSSRWGWQLGSCDVHRRGRGWWQVGGFMSSSSFGVRGAGSMSAEGIAGGRVASEPGCVSVGGAVACRVDAAAGARGRGAGPVGGSTPPGRLGGASSGAAPALQTRRGTVCSRSTPAMWNARRRFVVGRSPWRLTTTSWTVAVSFMVRAVLPNTLTASLRRRREVAGAWTIAPLTRRGSGRGGMLGGKTGFLENGKVGGGESGLKSSTPDRRTKLF
mmetsp:Transcript_24096/g.63679  ORF Transcript_24096/g.63679 Transcript_24096/m.63679 type:complete len:238 (+) Transcript_24096:1496-2209(+)